MEALGNGTWFESCKRVEVRAAKAGYLIEALLMDDVFLMYAKDMKCIQLHSRCLELMHDKLVD